MRTTVTYSCGHRQSERFDKRFASDKNRLRRLEANDMKTDRICLSCRQKHRKTVADHFTRCLSPEQVSELLQIAFKSESIKTAILRKAKEQNPEMIQRIADEIIENAIDQ